MATTLQETLRYTFPRMRVTIDGKDFDEDSTFVVIADMQRYGGVFHLCKDDSPDDGVLNVCCLHGTRVRDLARYAWGAFQQNLTDYNDIAFYRGRQIKLEADERVKAQVDGDRGNELPMLFTIIPGAASFCVEKS
jgi:diacylglycerol kinase (ATP)